MRPLRHEAEAVLADYRVNVVQIGKPEADSIARRADEGYAYIQVSLSVAEKAAEKREYRPFSLVRDNCPQYLLTLDPLPLERDGATHQNLVELMASGSELQGRSEGERVW